MSLVLIAIPLQAQVSAQRGSAESKLIDAAAAALGGKDRILAIKTVRTVAYGQSSYQDGGGNISASLHAPVKSNNISQDRVVDYANKRMRLGQRSAPNFVFVFERSMRGQRYEVGLDGDVAFSISGDGRATRLSTAAVRARRIEMLANPIGIIRAALDPGTRLSKLRQLDGVLAIDVTSADGDLLTLGINRATNLPGWVSWVQPDAYLGDLTLRTYFVGYQLENGVQVPSGYTTVTDFRNVIHEKLDVDRTSIDAPSDMIESAPQSLRAMQPPADNPTFSVEVVPIGKGIWYLKGQGNSTAFEFSDHIALFEPFGSPANMTAILEKARGLVPGKPVKQIIASHSHLDHNGGLRTAVAEGLEVIAHRNAVELFRELVARPAKEFPDALGRNPKPLKIIPVDDKLVLKDAAMEVHVLRVMRNNHMADALFAYAPAEKIVAQGDLFDEGWELVWWGNSYPDSVRHWNIEVDTDLAVHGNVNRYSRVLELLRKQAASAKNFCDTVERDDYMVPGCPATNVDF